MIGPRVKLIFKDGSKRKVELYNRPDVVAVEGKGGKVVLFHRTGPDEYEEGGSENEGNNSL